MSTTLTLSPSISDLKHFDGISINLAKIFRSQAFKITAEVITLLSLFTAVFSLMLAVPAL